MAHEIEFNEKKGTHSFVSVKEKPWHGLGTIVEGALTAEECIKAANLDFDIVKLPMLEQFPDGNDYITKESKEKFTTVRTDLNQTLGYVGSSYHILQNTEGFDFFDNIVGKGEAIYETAGVLGKGERIFITAKFPEYIHIDGHDGEEIEQYALLTNGHDGKSGLRVGITPVRVVCNNTLNLALRNMSNEMTLRHTTNMHEKLRIAHQIIGIKNLYKDELSDIFTKMAKTQANEDDYKKIIVPAIAGLAQDKKQKIDAYFRGEASTRFTNIVEDVLEYAYAHPTQQTIATKDTIYGAYNSISGFFQNFKDWKGDESKKLENFIDGDVAIKGKIAFDISKKMIGLN